MGLPSVVPSAETAASEVERQESEALADMFSPSSPHYDESIVAVPHTAMSSGVQTTSVTDRGAQFGGKDLHKTLDSSRGWYWFLKMQHTNCFEKTTIYLPLATLLCIPMI